MRIRRGAMTATALRRAVEILAAAYPPHLAARWGVSGRAVRYWLDGDRTVPGPIARLAAIETGLALAGKRPAEIERLVRAGWEHLHELGADAPAKEREMVDG